MFILTLVIIFCHKLAILQKSGNEMEPRLQLFPASTLAHRADEVAISAEELSASGHGSIITNVFMPLAPRYLQ